MGRYYPKYHVLTFRMHRPHILISTRVSGCMHIWPNQLKTHLCNNNNVISNNIYVCRYAVRPDWEIYGIQLCNVTWIIANIHEMSANFCSHATDDMLMLNDLVIIKPFTLWSHDNSFRHIYSHLSYSNILNCVILKLPLVAQNVQMQKKIYQIVRM